MKKLNEIEDKSMLSLSFNQDNSCFAIGMESGFKIYQTYPLKGPVKRKMFGGIGSVEMFYKSNFLALLGGGKIPKFNNNRVVIWDDFEEKIISEIKFITPILGIKLKKNLLFIICQKRIYVFNFNTYDIIEIIDTGDNKKGLIAINNSQDLTVIAYPSIKDLNYVTIKHFKPNKTLTILAHDDSVSSMTINYDGSLLATANEKGIFIRIYSCKDGTFLQEFKRGSGKVDYLYICFDNETRFMAVSSNKGTIHIFTMGNIIKKLKDIENMKHENENKNNEKLKNKKVDEKNDTDEKFFLEEKKEKDEFFLKPKDIKEEGKEEEKNIDKDKKEENLESKNIINDTNINNDKNNKNENEEELPKNVRAFFGFSQTEKSFAQFKIKPQKNICTFANNNILIVISFDNIYYQAEIDLKKGGICKKKDEINLIENNSI